MAAFAEAATSTGLNGHPECELGAVGIRVDIDLARMTLRDLRCDMKPQAEAAVRRLPVALGEWLEQLLLDVRRDRASAIPDGD